MSDTKGKTRQLVDEFPCTTCEEGICYIFLTPEVAKLAYGVEAYTYRCDRCGAKYAPGVYRDDSDLNLMLVSRRKLERSGVKWRSGERGECMGGRIVDLIESDGEL